MRRFALACVVVVCACSHDHRTPLVVYSPHGKALLSDLAQRFMRLHPDIDVQPVDMGAQEIIDRVRAEAVNSQADVWFGGPESSFERAAKEGLLEPYTPTWAAYVPAEARDSADRWFGTYLTPEVIGYNSVAIPDSAAPKDWDDVLDPKWKGKVLIRDPVASGSMRAIFGAILARSVTATGSTAAGWTWLKRLDANTKEYALNPTLLYQKLGRQEGVITLWDMPDIATLQDRLHIPVKYTVPASGTPILVEGIAIVKGTKHLAAAKAFYEFVTTPEMLLVAAREDKRIPVRTDMPEDSLPEWIRAARREIKPMPVNRALLADSLDDWMTYWDSHIRRHG
ncbi:MAG TPA: extracellular solute-binding protein [Gemmatimonadaceae bacterium]|nr:extracellular solute-binding protein [Gemmatimonadaceae bacterium]